MKLTVKQLRRIIKEEVSRAVAGSFDDEDLDIDIDIDEEAFEDDADQRRAEEEAAKEAELVAAAKSMLLDPAHRKELVPLLNAKRRERPGTKAGRAASAAVTAYIEGAFPDLDPLAVHRRLTNLVDQIYGRP